ncbi:MAG: hypothetical protein AAFY41_00525, partial [Bacteroidota bacterium]
EFLDDVGGGSWWVKHSWVVDGEGYQNWPLDQFAIDYGPGTYAEGILMEDGLSVKIGDLDVSETGSYNIRQPITDTNPVSFHISSYPDAGSAEPVSLGVYTITENPSPFDGLARFSHVSTGNEPVAEPFSLQGDEDESADYEILQIVSETEIIAWANIDDITQAEFDALVLPEGWSKNQPRVTLWDGGEFASSPGQEDGILIEEEIFGFQWRHVATVGGAYPIDPESILVGSDVFKHHTVFYNQGSTVRLVVNPEGETYLFATRDLNRPSDIPTLPEGWRHTEFTTEADIQLQLPNPTVNIRADNQDSFQGPITEDDFEPRQ